ncbi:MAG: DUF1343 domain-containing protein [Verrucomicrobiota bacterium]|nr:DUF1343 domain-containing protein [Verrucomicrobiota bacterium]
MATQSPTPEFHEEPKSTHYTRRKWLQTFGMLGLGTLGGFTAYAGTRTAPTRPGSTSSGISSWFHSSSSGQTTIITGIGAPPTDGRILLGIDVLAQHGFAPLKGKRVGLLTHPAGVNRNGTITVDVLKSAPGVRLTALFGPEHGIYGDEKANVEIGDRTDPRTGLPVYSLYGKTRRPTEKMLAQIDVMVIDLQDLGVRSYTYTSSMRYTMETCFKYGVEVVILDRPNPIGGLKVDGPPLDKEWMSYVGAFRVPYVHGLTIGELARLAKETEGWLEVEPAIQKKGKLTVVCMHGWQRRMQWPETGLTWIKTSPAIPDISAAMGYSMTGLGAQLGGFKHGYGTRYPFRLLQYTGRQPEEIASALRSRNIQGLDYTVINFKEDDGSPRRGCYIIARDWKQVRPTEISFQMMKIACEWAKDGTNPFSTASKNDGDLFNKHVGSTAFWEALTRDGAAIKLEPFLNDWQTRARIFQGESRRGWLYA